MCVGGNGRTRVKYSPFIVESQPIKSKTEESRTTSTIVLLRNMVADPGETSKKSGKWLSLEAGLKVEK